MKKVIAVISTDQHLDLDNISTWISCMKEGDELAIKHNVPLFLLGDLFESRKGQTQELLNVVHDYLKESKVQKYCIPGNHDKQTYDSKDSYLDAFTFHPNFHLIRDYDVDSFFSSFNLEQCQLHFIPYFLEGPLYLNYLDIAKNSLRENKINILLTHISINGSKNNDGELIVGGLSAELFECFDYTYVGHYHNKGKITPKIEYIGSLFQQNFSEDTNKGFTLLYDDGTISQIKSTFKEYQTLTINLDIVSQKELEDLTQEIPKESKFTRYEFVGTYEKLKSINQSYYKSLGFDVKIKRDKIDSGIKEAQLHSITQFNKTTIVTEFEKFCTENQLEYNEGIKYLNQKLNK